MTDDKHLQEHIDKLIADIYTIGITDERLKVEDFKVLKPGIRKKLLTLLHKAEQEARYDELAVLNTKCAENGWHSAEVMPMFQYLANRSSELKTVAKDKEGGA